MGVAVSDRSVLALSLADKKALERWFPTKVPKASERFDVEYPALIAFAREAIKTVDEHDSYTPMKALPLDELQYLYVYFAALLNEHRVAVSKSRQILASWATYAYAYWRLLRYRGQKGALVPKKKEDGESHIEERMKMLLENSPKFLRDLIEIRPIHGAFIVVTFRGVPWNSRLLSYPQGSPQLRQHVFSFIIWDEAAHQPKMAASWQAAAPTIQGRGGLRGQVVMISSAKPRSYMKDMMGEHLRLAVAVARGVSEPTAAIVRPMQGVSVYRHPTSGFYCICIHDTADKLKRDPAWKETESAIYPGGVNSTAWQEEHEMNWWAEDQLRTYWAYDPTWSLVPPFQIPKDWRISLGFDFGSTDPTVCTFFAQNPETSEIVGFDEIYVTKTPVKDICREIYSRLSLRLGLDVTPINIGEVLEDAIGDPSGAGYAMEYGQDPWPIAIRTKLGLKGPQTRRESGEASVNSALCPSVACCGKRWYSPVCGDCKGTRQGERKPKPLLTFMAGRCPNLERTMPEIVRVKAAAPGLEPDEKNDRGQDDHACLIGGTLVTTPTGLATLDSLRVGDLVETRVGPRRVIGAGKTGYSKDLYGVELSTGQSLIGTHDHPVWVVGKGMTRIDALRYGDILLGCETKSSPSMASGTGVTRNPGGAQIGSTTQPVLAAEAQGDSTRPSGCRPTDQSQPATTSITRTETHSTTLSKIWGACRVASISLVTPVARLLRSYWRTWLEFGPSLFGGTTPTPAALGIESTPNDWPLDISAMRWYASNADGTISEVGRMERFAPITAEQPTAVPAASTTSGEFARTAESASSLTDTRNQGIVRGNAPVVLAVRPTGRDDVYNITVEDAHEYYANGVLVSNCDSVLYRIRAAFFELPPEAKKRDILNTPSRLLRSNELVQKVILRAQHDYEMEKLTEGDDEVLVAHGHLVELEETEEGGGVDGVFGDTSEFYSMGVH